MIVRVVINSHKINCTGCCLGDGGFVMDVWSSGTESVIVKVFEDGSSLPLCKFYDSDSGKCFARKKEELRCCCPYASGPVVK